MSEQSTHDRFKLRTAPDGDPNVRFVGRHYCDGVKRETGHFPGTDFAFAHVEFHRAREAEAASHPLTEKWDIHYRGEYLVASAIHRSRNLIAGREEEVVWLRLGDRPTSRHATVEDAMRHAARYLIEEASFRIA